MSLLTRLFGRTKSKDVTAATLDDLARKFCTLSLQLLIKGTFGETKEQELKICHYLLGVFEAAKQISENDLENNALEAFAVLVAFLQNEVGLPQAADVGKDVLESQDCPGFQRYRREGGQTFLDMINKEIGEEATFKLSHLLRDDTERAARPGPFDPPKTKEAPGPWWENL